MNPPTLQALPATGHRPLAGRSEPGSRGGEAGHGGADLRLAGLAAGTWLAVLLTLRLRPGAALAVALGAAAPAAAAALLVAVHLRRARRTPPRAGTVLLILAPVLFGMVCGSTATAARTATRGGPLARLVAAGATVRAELTLTDDPRPTRQNGFGPATWVVPATLLRLDTTGRVTRLRARALVMGSDASWAGLLPGQRVAITARLAPPRDTDLTAAVLSARTAPRLIGAAPWHQRLAGRLRAGLQRACRGLPDHPGGLLPGLVDGDTSRLDPGVAQDFRTAGMTHLVAVSGSNLGMVLGFILVVARWSRLGPRIAVLVGLLSIVGFVVLVRPDPSVLRAAVMGAFSLLAIALHRERAALPGLAVTVFVLLVADPQLAVEPGFLLSTLATVGLLLLAPSWRDALRRHHFPPLLAEAIAVPVAAQLACAPVIAALDGTIGLAAVPANMLAEPVVAPATVLGVGAAVLSPVSLTAAHLLAWLAAWPCRWLILVARHAADAPAGVLPWPAGVLGGLLLAVLLLALLALAAHRLARRLAILALLAVAIGALPVRLVTGGWPPAGWVLVACDVGQGDGLVLNIAPGQAVVVDTGPEPTAIDHCLRDLNVHLVPLLVLTHYDADHVSGIPGVFHDRSVLAVLTSRYDRPAGGRTRVLRAATSHGLATYPAVPGWSYTAGQLHLEVLGRPTLATGTESDSNNNCVVLRATIHGVSVLLTGDAGPEEQAELRTTGTPLHADVLKLPHHGSRHQDPRFVDAVHPAVVLVSVGAHNDYGHPNPALLTRLTRAGIRVLRTDRQGDVAVLATARGIAVAQHGPAPGRAPP